MVSTDVAPGTIKRGKNVFRNTLRAICRASKIISEEVCCEATKQDHFIKK